MDNSTKRDAETPNEHLEQDRKGRAHQVGAFHELLVASDHLATQWRVHIASGLQEDIVHTFTRSMGYGMKACCRSTMMCTRREGHTHLDRLHNSKGLPLRHFSAGLWQLDINHIPQLHLAGHQACQSALQAPCMWGQLVVPLHVRGGILLLYLSKIRNADRGNIPIHLCPLMGLGVLVSFRNCTPQPTYVMANDRIAQDVQDS